MTTLRRGLQRVLALDPQLRLFAAGVLFLGITAGMFETTFNNYVSDTFDITPHARGRLEFPRELPGFLTALMAGLLFFVPETRVASLAAGATGVGLLLIAWHGDAWAPFLLYLTLWSIGSHLIMPVQGSLTMELANARQRGRRLGQISGIGTLAGLIGCLGVWILRPHGKGDYRLLLTLAGFCALLAAILFYRMRMPNAHLSRPRFVWNRRYWLYYVLAFLFGARKQIFLTFGPWVLVRIFGQPAHIFAALWIAAALIGVWFHPLLGHIIDRLGERLVLMIDSVLVFGVCLGYGFSNHIGNQALALGLLYACYILDNLLFGVNMARSTYLSKIAVRPQDVSPTLSLGITINHAVSMTIPSVGGWVWMQYGHSYVFLAAAVIALFMLAFTSLLRITTPTPPPAATL